MKDKKVLSIEGNLVVEVFQNKKIIGIIVVEVSYVYFLQIVKIGVKGVYYDVFRSRRSCEIC